MISQPAYSSEELEYSRFYETKIAIQKVVEQVAFEYVDKPKTKKTQKEIEQTLIKILREKAKTRSFAAYVFCDDRNNPKDMVNAGVLIFTVDAVYKDNLGQIRWQFSAMLGKEIAQLFVNVEDSKPKTMEDLYNWGTLYK